MSNSFSRIKSVLKSFPALITAAIYIGFTPPGHGDLIAVNNASFEDSSGGFIFNEFSFGVPAGWSLYDPHGITGAGAGPQFYLGTLDLSPPVFFSSDAPEGQRVGIAYNAAGTGGLGAYGLQQTLTATLQGNTRYALSVEIGNIASGTAANGAFFNLAGFPGYRIELLAGGAILASDNNSLGATIPEGTFATSNFEFVTNNNHPQLGQPLSLRLINLNQIHPTFPTADLEVDFDHVRLSGNAIPEPSVLLLMAPTVILFSSMRRRLATPGSS